LILINRFLFENIRKIINKTLNPQKIQKNHVSKKKTLPKNLKKFIKKQNEKDVILQQNFQIANDFRSISRSDKKSLPLYLKNMDFLFAYKLCA
jgi:hypothetical protein